MTNALNQAQRGFKDTIDDAEEVTIVFLTIKLPLASFIYIKIVVGLLVAFVASFFIMQNAANAPTGLWQRRLKQIIYDSIPVVIVATVLGVALVFITGKALDYASASTLNGIQSEAAKLIQSGNYSQAVRKYNAIQQHRNVSHELATAQLLA